MVGTVQVPGRIGPACRPLWPRFYSNATSKTKFLCRPRLRREAGGQRRDINQTSSRCSLVPACTKQRNVAGIVCLWHLADIHSTLKPCPLLGVKRTSLICLQMSVNDPKRTLFLPGRKVKDCDHLAAPKCKLR